MPLLRAKELTYQIGKARVTHALCDSRLKDEMEFARTADMRVAYFYGEEPDGLEASMARTDPEFANVDTAWDDLALIAFTSGSTGAAKGTMHFHRDVLAICDCFGGHVLQPTPEDIFCGTPPLAFTFGLGGMVLFPMRVGASTLLTERNTPESLLQAIQDHRCTIVFTAPTMYRQMAELAFASTSVRFSSPFPRARRCRLPSIRPGTSHGAADGRRHRRDGDAAHLHQRQRRRDPRRRHG